MKFIERAGQILNMKWISLLLISIFLVISFGTGKSFIDIDQSEKITLIGAEYASIAKSIISGEGYSNPFECCVTGPTSWMPPLLVYIYVCVFLIFGISYKAYLIIGIIRLTGYLFTFYFLSKSLEKVRIKTHNMFLAVVYILYLRLGGWEIIDLSMEHWIYHFFGALSLFAFTSYIKEGKHFILLAFLFFILPLSAPALFIPLSIILFIIFIRYLFRKKDWIFSISPNITFYHFLIFGFLSFASVSIWTYRNFRVFDEIILSKSNTWFEFYMSNIIDSKGVLHNSTFYEYHPLFNEEICEEMSQMGEIKWLSTFKDSADIYLKEHSREYWNKVNYRAYNMLIFQKKMNDLYPAQMYNLFSKRDKEILIENKLLRGNIVGKLYWMCLNMDDDNAKKLFYMLNLDDPEKVYIDYSLSKVKFNTYSIKNLIFGFSKAGLPFLSLILLFIFYWNKEREFVIIIGLLYLVYCMPFILISFTSRYQLFILQFQSLLVAILIGTLYHKIVPLINKRLHRKII